jgi:TetR/AcrR family transcriptional regulator, transcriptional repressor of bet genes
MIVQLYVVEQTVNAKQIGSLENMKKLDGQIDGREQRGGATRAALIDAVITCVARHGLERTTISKLSEITGLSRGLISFHFEGKDRLLSAALAHAIAIYEESWEKNIMRPDVKPSERLHLSIDHDVDFALNNPDILSLWWSAWGETRAKEIYRSSSSARDQRFVSDLKNTFVAAGLSKTNAVQAAAAVNAFLLGYWLQHHLDEDMHLWMPS